MCKGWFTLLAVFFAFGIASVTASPRRTTTTTSTLNAEMGFQIFPELGNPRGSTSSHPTIGDNAPSSSSVSEIRSAIEGYRQAVLHKDMQGITRYYWNSPEIVIFDVVPPLSYVGWDSFRKDWQGFFDSFKEITVYDWSDLHVEAEPNLGWMRAFIHLVGKFQDGKNLDMTTRDTAIFERKDGRWVTVHDHGSVPIIFETGQGVMNALPK